MRPLHLFCGILALSAISSLAAHADPISFTETVTGSGSLNGVSFTNQLITLTGSGNTSAIQDSGSLFTLDLTTASVQIGAGSADNFTSGVEVFSNPGTPGAGFTSLSPFLDILDTVNPGFITYALNTSISETGSSLWNSAANFGTTAGNFKISNVAGDSTFTSSLSAAAAPEPSSLLLLGTGLVGAAGMVRRKLGFC